MEQILDIFNPQVHQSGDTITLTYCHLNYSGTCTYKEVILKGKIKPIKQRIHLLTHTDMGDVIEYMYKNDLFNGEDSLPLVSQAIQNHSRGVLERYLQ